MASASFSSHSFGGLNNSFNPASTSNHQAQPKVSPVDLPALQNASRVLLNQFSKDFQIIPDIGETLTTRMWQIKYTLFFLTFNPAGGQASASYSVFRDDIRVPFQKRRFVGIPDGLFQYYDSEYSVLFQIPFNDTTLGASVTSHMGLMPEIERVWISIDHKLFLWDYNDGCVNFTFIVNS